MEIYHSLRYCKTYPAIHLEGEGVGEAWCVSWVKVRIMFEGKYTSERQEVGPSHGH